MKLLNFVLLSLFVSLCLAAEPKQKVCLYSQASSKVLTPLQLSNSNCAGNTSYCMNKIYNYYNYQYNGISSLKPAKGEIVMFLAQDEQGKFDLVTFLNANVTTTLKVYQQITGAKPTGILLYDDPAPEDVWVWNPATNTGNFTWTTQPTYTDGVIIGHIDFIDNYCVRSSFTQPNAALNKISIMSGTASSPNRILTVPYVSGTQFEFCQYPVTGTTHTDVTCPGANDGTVSIWIVFGPSNVKYVWTNSAGTVVATTANVANLPADTYSVFVNDTSSNGCTATRTLVVTEPTMYSPLVSATNFTCVAKGSASATPQGGSGGLTIRWFRASGTQIGTGSAISNLNVGNYYVTVTDSCGSVGRTDFPIVSSGCCGDGACSAEENVCGSAQHCEADCGICCPAGTYRSGATCVVCPPGSQTSATNKQDQCDQCPQNTFNAGGNSPCNACNANSYSAAGSGKCTRCPAGQVRGAGETSCHSCGDGFYASSPCGTGGCAQCDAGTFAVDGAESCNTCSPGTFSAAGSSSCSTCPANSYSAAGAASCSSCPGGTNSAAGSTHILACITVGV